MSSYKIIFSDELMHYGRRNMKWGRRLYQNKDGSLTPLGRIHYGYGPSRKSSDNNGWKTVSTSNGEKSWENLVSSSKGTTYDVNQSYKYFMGKNPYVHNYYNSFMNKLNSGYNNAMSGANRLGSAITGGYDRAKTAITPHATNAYNNAMSGANRLGSAITGGYDRAKTAITPHATNAYNKAMSGANRLGSAITGGYYKLIGNKSQKNATPTRTFTSNDNYSKSFNTNFNNLSRPLYNSPLQGDKINVSKAVRTAPNSVSVPIYGTYGKKDKFGGLELTPLNARGQAIPGPHLNKHIKNGTVSGFDTYAITSRNTLWDDLKENPDRYKKGYSASKTWSSNW